MSNNYYDTLGVGKNASDTEIKKAYRKQAMKYHPDRNAGDKAAESKIKEINTAYDILGDSKKKKQYDTFGSAGGNPFGGGAGGGYSSQGFGGFEDIFGGMGGTSSRGGETTFNMEDLFGGSMGGGFGGQQSTRQKTQAKKPVNLDFEKTYEIPIFDLILGCKIEVKGVYGNTAKLKIPPSTKPGKKFRVKGFGKKEPGKEGNLIVKVEALMPKNISEVRSGH
ncbi:MAG: DnaJ domain-containing protein, partial [Candidatus Gracilibacteria bacterium]